MLFVLALISLTLSAVADPKVTTTNDIDDKPEIHGAITPSPGITLGAKDFTSDLPEHLRDEQAECKTATLRIDKRVEFEVDIHYDQLIEHPNYFRRAEVSMSGAIPGVAVGVVFGFPSNLGTAETPMMAVPLTLQWAGEGWLHGEQWTLYADGRLEKTE